MKMLRFTLFSLLLAWLYSPLAALADDIDIYSANASAGVPNVLFVFDNAANFSSNAAGSTCVIDGVATALSGTVGGIEQCALYSAIQALPDSTVNIGMMVYNANNIRDINEANCGGASGGCLMVPLMLMNAANKTSMLNWIKTWVTTGGAGHGYIKASGEATGAAMQEAWAYYKGASGLSGRDYSGVAPTAGCQKNFVVFVGNSYSASGTPGDGGSASPKTALESAPGVTAAQTALITSTMATSCGTYTFPSAASTHENGGYYADEWARYMAQSDLASSLDAVQNITTYTIGVLGASCQAEYAATLTSMARVGGGKYFPTSDSSTLVQAMLSILNEVQAVNSVFASSSLPVSVNAQGTYLNQIYMGMFRPDANASPRWLGNLKQYQFINDSTSGELRLGDSAGLLAVSSAGTGFITPGAISFWTAKNLSTAPDSTGGFWVNDQRGTALGYDSPDGELVEKGGAAQQLRLKNITNNYTTSPTGPRNLYTYCPSGTGCVASLTDGANAFATTNAAITTALLGGVTPVNITSVTRSGTTATATTSGNHGFNSGQNLCIAGANQSEYNGSVSATVTSATKFTYTVPEYPSSPATGSYTATIPSNQQSVTSLSRSGTLATVTLNGHGFVNGQTVTISNAAQSQYNGSHVISAVDANHFSYTVVVGPATPAGSGTATSGSNSAGIALYTAAHPGIVRDSSATTNNVTVYTTSNHGFGTSGNVTISGVIDSTGALIPEYNLTNVAFVRDSVKEFTYTVATTPVSPATAAGGSAGIKADGGTSAKALTLTRSGNTVTATSAAHGFLSGQTVSIAAASGGAVANESGYIGSFTISGVTANTFTYSVVTTPVTPATGTMTVTGGGTIDRTTLINWVRGEDNFGDELSPGSPYTMRPSVHGDVLHSRPVVVNYGAAGVVVYYGSNDGVFHAVNGNKTNTIGGVVAGGEMWGLVLPEFYGKLSRLRTNSPALQLPTTPNGLVPAPQAKDYFVDGTTGTYQKTDASGASTSAYLYLVMRRGGRFMYALDVSSATSPRVQWTKRNTDSGFGELGQTWSRPRVALLKGYNGPVLIFGAGYDTAEDSEPPGTDTMGRGIYIVDALTGALVRSFAAGGVSGMDYSIAADVALLDRDHDGKVDRLYAADTGGNVWRIDFEPSTAAYGPNDWQITRLAALGCDSGACSAGGVPRKFFFAPSVVATGAANAVGSYDAVLLGSGDREHPLYSSVQSAAYNVQNDFFMLKDTKTGKSATGLATITLSSLKNVTTNSLYDGTLSGYYFKFGTGEKSVNAPLTLGGTTYFGTNQPSPPSAASCTTNLGTARAYSVSTFTGEQSTTTLDGGGLPPSPTAGIVTDNTGKLVSFCIGCVSSLAARSGVGGTGPGDTNCASSLDNCYHSESGSAKLKRTYWYKK